MYLYVLVILTHINSKITHSCILNENSRQSVFLYDKKVVIIHTIYLIYGIQLLLWSYVFLEHGKTTK